MFLNSSRPQLRETGKKLKCIWTDNGGEYIGSFEAYFKEHGI